MSERNLKRFNVIGTIGNGSELRPVPRQKPTHSYHLTNVSRGEEIAIRYNDIAIHGVFERHWIERFEDKSLEEAPRECFAIEIKPILLQELPQ